LKSHEPTPKGIVYRFETMLTHHLFKMLASTV